MTAPTPPGDVPLFEGLGPEWNDIVGAFPEDKRSELAPVLKSRLDQYEPLKPWAEFQSQGVTPEQAKTALNLFNIIENNPKQVYDTIGSYLGITPQQAKQLETDLNNQKQQSQQQGEEEDPRIAAMQEQLNTLAQIELAKRQFETERQQQAEQDAALEKELTNLKNKYGADQVNEREIIMRMLYNDGMSAEQAFQDYSNMVNELRKSRPAPMLLGNGGAIPQRAIDPTKLDNQGTKALVAQMLEHAKNEARQ